MRRIAKTIIAGVVAASMCASPIGVMAEDEPIVEVFVEEKSAEDTGYDEVYYNDGGETAEESDEIFFDEKTTEYEAQDELAFDEPSLVEEQFEDEPLIEEDAIIDEIAGEAPAEAVVDDAVDELITEDVTLDEEPIASEDTSLAGTSGSCGTNATWTLTGTGSDLTLTISGSGNMTDYTDSTIPWASDRAKIKTVVVESGITSVGDYAFYRLNNLSSVTLPTGLKSIGWYTFANDTKITEIEIPGGAIGYGAFSGCTGLESISLLEGVTSIGSYAFSGCTGIVDLVVPDSVTIINSYAFTGCTNLKSIVLSKNLTSIYYDAFYNCTSLDGVVLPDSLTILGNDVFYNCSSLTSIVIPEKVTQISSSVFDSCSSLKEITLHQGITSIGQSAFSGCSSLTSIDIPDSVSSIGSYAFYGCSSLTSVVIPEGVPGIAYELFYNCTSLTSVTIPESATYIGGEAFYGCTNLESVEIPGGVTSIGNSAFYGCTSLSSVDISGSVTSIGSFAFAGSALTSINLPDAIETIRYGTFTKCEKLETVKLPASLTVIEDDDYYYDYYDGSQSWTGGVFAYCCSLKSIELPDGLTKIGSYAFYNCTSLEILEIPDSVTSIGNSAFSWCTSLSSADISGSVTCIGNYAFYNCTSLSTLEIPFSVTSIGSYAFAGSALTSISLPDAIETICSGTFTKCEKLETVKLPASLTVIEDGNGSYYDGNQYWTRGVFAYCSSLKDIELPDGLTTIGSYAFIGCTKLASVDMPATVTSIGSLAFKINDRVSSEYTGKKFLGWSETKDGSQIVDIYNYRPQYNVTLYAIWKELIKVTYDAGEGYFEDVWDADEQQYVSNVSSVAQYIDEGEHTYNHRVKTNQTDRYFAGWSLEKDGEVLKNISEYSPEKNCTLYAVWKDIYTVTLDANGGIFKSVYDEKDGKQVYNVSSYNERVTEGSALGSVTAPVYDGKTCIGWSTKVDGEIISDRYNYKPTGNITFYAIWADLYTITLDANGGLFKSVYDEVDDKTANNVSSYRKVVVKGGRVNDYSTPVLNGKKCDGYSFERGGNAIENLYDFKPTDNMTLYAVWKDIYTITLDANGGIFQSAVDSSLGTVYNHTSYQKQVVEGDYLYSFTTPTRTGKQCVGWSKEKNGEAIEGLDRVKASSNMTLYAVWKDYYTVTFNANGGLFKNAYDSITGQTEYNIKSYRKYVLDGQSVNGYTTPVNEGKTFCGWSEKKNGEIIKDFYNYKPSNDCTFYAVWKIKYTVTLDANGGTIYSNILSCYEGETVALPTPSGTDGKDQLFLGWSLKRDGTPVVTANQGSYKVNMTYKPSKDCTLYAVWTKDYYTVTIMGNGGSLIQRRTYERATSTATNTTTISQAVEQVVGSGSALTLRIAKGEKVYLGSPNASKGIVPSLASKVFIGWTDTKNGTPMKLEADDEGVYIFTPTSNCTLYALWNLKAEEIILDQTSLKLLIGSTAVLKPYVFPSSAQDKTVLWKSSNTKVAKVNKSGIITAVGKGTATIMASSNTDSTVNAVCAVTVTQPVSKITLNKTKASINTGKTVTLKATVSPKTADDQGVVWKSSNKKVVTVTQKGVVKGLKKGTAKITAVAKDGSGVSAVCTVTVLQPVTKIKLNKTSATVKAGKSMTLKATISPDNASNKEVVWKSSNTKVATVTQKGVVKGVKAGTTTITVTAKDGSGKNVKCIITVK